jgi:hypothetical protein
MTLQEQYKKETNLEAYELDTLNNGYDNFKYVKWLEAKLTIPDVVASVLCVSDESKEFKNKMNYEKYRRTFKRRF